MQDTLLTRIYNFLQSILSLVIHFFFIDKHAVKVDRGPAFRNTIVVVGDDVAFGTGDTCKFYEVPGIARPLGNELRRLPQIRQTWDIYNKGVAGSTTREWLPTSLKTTQTKTHFEKIVSKSPYKEAKIVILALGFCDGRNNIKPNETVANIKGIVTVLMNMGMLVILLPVPNHGDHLFNDSLYGDNLELNTMLADLVKETDGLVMGPQITRDNFEYKGDFLYHKDGQHFSSRGYSKLGKDLAEILTNRIVQMEFAIFKNMFGGKAK